MAEALEKIQALLKESKVFALVSKKNCEEHKLLAKEALKNSFLENNLNAVSLPEHADFQKKWKTIIPEEKNTQILQKTSLKIPKNQCKIKELSYEEDENFFSLVITVEKGELNKNIVSFEPVLQKADVVFCFFDPCEAEALEEYGQKIIMPPKEKVIFLSSSNITFAEKIFQIITAAAPGRRLSNKTTTLLFASLITETGNFTKPISQEVLRFGSELLSLEADKEAIKAILNEEKTIFSAQLLGRALARTHIDSESPVSWTFLNQKDLEKTSNSGLSSLSFYNVLKNIRENIPYKPLSLLFWQDSGQNIYATAAADDEKELVPLAEAIGVKLQSKYFTTGPFSSFSEAEIKFRQALKGNDFLQI